MKNLGLNINLFKKLFDSDSYWSTNLGLKDYGTIKYLLNRIEEETELLDKFELSQTIIEYTRTRQSVVPKYNAYVYQELRNQVEYFQNEIKSCDWQIETKFNQQKEHLAKVFNC
jgi:hypothetical protein